MAAAVKRSRGDDEDGRVHEKGERQRDCGIQLLLNLDRLALAFSVTLVVAGLHHGGMQIKIVRHHRCTKDADRYIAACRGLVRMSLVGTKILPSAAA